MMVCFEQITFHSILLCSYWRCTNRGDCTARVTTQEVSSLTDSVCLLTLSLPAHSHPPRPAVVGRRVAITAMCSKAAANPLAPPRTAHSDVACETVRENLATVPTYRSVESIIRRQRLENIPKLPVERKDINITGSWAETIDGNRFLINVPNDPNDPNKMLVFASDEDLRLLAESKIIHVDGTFKVCPKQYSQLFTIHGVVESLVVPLVYALLPDKCRSTYFNLLTLIRTSIGNLGLALNPEVIVSDFEFGELEALRQHFPNARLVGCYFHFCQAVWRKVQELGLAVRYKTEITDFQLHVKSHMALAFLPTCEVKNFFDNLRASTKYIGDTQVQKFHEYFCNTWVDGLFAINLWNQFDVPDQQRTNNTVEGWHCRFGGYVRSVHPNIYIYITHSH